MARCDSASSRAIGNPRASPTGVPADAVRSRPLSPPPCPKSRLGAIRKSRRRPSLAAEGLDPRLLLSGVDVLSASTADSKGVTISYEIASPGGDPALSFGVYRSATATYGTDAEEVGTDLSAPAVDSSGQPSTGPGAHTVTLPIPGGLPINPEHPYVLVVADPGSASAGSPGTVASFRVASIAIVTHGGLEDKAWDKVGPPWEQQMAKSLKAQGFDEVIAFNWVAESSTPGAAVKQVPRLTADVLDDAAKFPAGEPVDLQFIGHSEGAVINTQAIVKVEAAASPGISAGYLDDTLLDPHAANPDFPGQQYSTGGPLGWIAKLAIDNYQARSRDPLVFIPAGVDSAQVFYQQTPADHDASNDDIYNLWGQVPVKGDATYYNLTADGIVHSGKQGVYAWYEHHIVPTLGNGAPELAATALTGSPVASASSSSAPARTATYTGRAEPGSTVRLSAAVGHGPLHLVAKAVTAPDGTWTATTKPLAPGTYRVLAEAKPADWTFRSRRAIPTDPLGALTIARE